MTVTFGHWKGEGAGGVHSSQIFQIGTRFILKNIYIYITINEFSLNHCRDTILVQQLFLHFYNHVLFQLKSNENQ